MKAAKKKITIERVAGIATIVGLLIDIGLFKGDVIINWVLSRAGELLALLLKPVEIPLILVIVLFGFAIFIVGVFAREYFRKPDEPMMSKTEFNGLLLIAERKHGDNEIIDFQCAQCEGRIDSVTHEDDDFSDTPLEFRRSGYWGVGIYCENGHFVGRHWTTSSRLNSSEGVRQAVIHEFVNRQIVEFNRLEMNRFYKTIPRKKVNFD